MKIWRSVAPDALDWSSSGCCHTGYLRDLLCVAMKEDTRFSKACLLPQTFHKRWRWVALRQRPDKRRKWTGGRLGGIDINGQKHRLNGFTFALGHSRTMMAKAVDRQLVHVNPRDSGTNRTEALGPFAKSVGHWTFH